MIGDFWEQKIVWLMDRSCARLDVTPRQVRDEGANRGFPSTGMVMRSGELERMALDRRRLRADPSAYRQPRNLRPDLVAGKMMFSATAAKLDAAVSPWSVGLRVGLLFGPVVFGVTAAGVALPAVANDLRVGGPTLRGFSSRTRWHSCRHRAFRPPGQRARSASVAVHRRPGSGRRRRSVRGGADTNCAGYGAAVPGGWVGCHGSQRWGAPRPYRRHAAGSNPGRSRRSGSRIRRRRYARRRAHLGLADVAGHAGAGCWLGPP